MLTLTGHFGPKTLWRHFGDTSDLWQKI